MVAIQPEGKRAAQINVSDGMRRDVRQELRLIERRIGVDLILQLLCIERHHDVGQQGQRTGDGNEFLVASSAFCAKRTVV